MSGHMLRSLHTTVPIELNVSACRYFVYSLLRGQKGKGDYSHIHNKDMENERNHPTGSLRMAQEACISELK